MLYSAMEDGFIDILIGEAEKKAIKVSLEPFTLVGATTRSGMLSAPLRDRFGMMFRLQYYRIEDLSKVVLRAASALNVELTEATATTIAKRSRGTPRIALNMLRRVRDVLETKDLCGKREDNVCQALKMLGVNEVGLNQQDIAYLKILSETFSGGPVGLNTLASALSEDAGTLEETIEPYLIQEGFIKRTARGREIVRRDDLDNNH